MTEVKPSVEEIHDRAAAILNLQTFQRDLVMADVWFLAGAELKWLDGDIEEYIEEVKSHYFGWTTEDFATLFYVLTGEKVE